MIGNAKVYTIDFSTNAGSANFGKDPIADRYGDHIGATTQPYGNPNIGGTEFTSTEYSDLASSDDNRVGYYINRDYEIYHFNFTLNLTTLSVSSIEAIHLLVEGYGDSYVCHIYVWNWSSSVYEEPWSINYYGADIVHHFSITNGISNYINPTNGSLHFEFSAYTTTTSSLWADYVQMKILYINNKTYSLEHKWSLTLPQSSQVDVYVEAHTTGEEFKFYCDFDGSSVDSGTYMFSVTSTTDTLYHYSYGSFAGGTFYIGVVDTDHTSIDTFADTIYIDNIKVRVYIANPYYDVEFKISGLNATYTYMRLNITGYKSNNEAVWIYIWNESQSAWVNASNYISIGTSLATYHSTTTYLYQNITSDGVLYIRFVNQHNSTETTADAWLNLTFVGVDIKTSENAFYADSGYFTRKVNLVTNTSVQKVIAEWTASDILGEKVFRKTAYDASNTYTPSFPFAGGTYKIQLLYYQNEINQYGIIDKICFEKADSDTGTYHLQIYLVEVTRTNLANSFADNYEGKTPIKVFDGDVSFSGGDGTWFPIDVDNVFTYHNNTNLLIEIRYQNAPNEITCYEDSVTNYREMAATSVSAVTGTTYQFVPSCRLDIIRPSNFEVYVTRNGGKNWHKVNNNEIFVFPNSDELPYNEFNYKICFYSENSTRDDTPILHDIKFTIYVAVLTRSPTPLFGENNSRFGWSVDGVGDINNGSKDDVLVGSPDYPYVTYDFENYSVGSKPPDWEINEGSGTSISIVSGNYLQIYDPSDTSSANASRYFPSPTQKLIVECKVNITHKGWFDVMLTNEYLYTNWAPKHYFATQLYFNDSDMNIYWFNRTNNVATPHVIQPWTTNRTYSLRFVVDLTAQTWDIYINGSLVYENAKFLNSADNITRIYFGTSSDVNIVTALIDDVRIPLKPSMGLANIYFGENVLQNYSKSYILQDDYKYWESSLSFSNPNKGMYVTNYTPYAYLNLSGSNALEDNADGITASWTTVGTGGTFSQSAQTYVSKSHSYEASDTATTDYILVRSDVTYPSKYAVSFWINVSVTGGVCTEVAYLSASDVKYTIWSIGVIDGHLKWLYDSLNGIWVDCQTPVTISANTWYWIYVVVDDVTDTYDIYVNGSEVQNDATFVDTTDTPNVFYIVNTRDVPSGNVNTVTAYFDEIYISTYPSIGYYESPAIQLPGYVTAVKFSLNKCVPEGTSYKFYVSRDGGKTWSDISPYETVEYWFTSEPAGKFFRFNITMNGNGYASPIIWNISITIRYVVSGVEINGSRSGDLFGYSVGGGGNIANDTSLPDLIVGAPGNDSADGTKLDAGAFYIFPGRVNWKSTYNATDAYFIFYGENAGDEIGYAVNGEVMDVRGDGYPNFVVTAPYFDNTTNDNCGRTYIFRLVGLGGQLGAINVTLKLDSEQTGFVGMAKLKVKELKVYNVSFYAYNDISMPTQDDVWIVGDGGLILNTSTFTSSTPYWYLQNPTTANLYSISMATITSGIICGDEVILYTTDGKTWQASTDTDISGYVWYSVYYDGTHAWCVGTEKDGSGYRIIYSGDGGVSWTVNYSYTTGSLYAIDFYGNFGVVVGNGVINYTTDGGVTWNSPTTYDSTVNYRGVVVYSSTSAIAVGKGGKIFQTTDSSSTWSEMSSPTYQNLYDVDAVSSSEIVAVGDNGTILRYDGNSWQEFDITNSTQPLYGICTYSTNFYGVVGNSANILKYDGNWKIRYLPTGDILNLTINVTDSYPGAFTTIFYNYTYPSNSNIEFKSLGDARCVWVKSLKSTDGINWQYTNEWIYKYSGEYMGFEVNVSSGNLGYKNITKVVIEIYDTDGNRYYFRVITSMYRYGSNNATFRVLNIDYSTWPSGRYYAIFTSYDIDYANDYQAGPCDEKISGFYIT